MIKYLLSFLVLTAGFDNYHFYSDREVVALTLLGEARGEEKHFKGMAAVGQVIQNRINSDLFPNNARNVCLQKNQFECWSKFRTEKDLDKLLNSEYAEVALKYADKVIKGEKVDKRIPKYYYFFKTNWNIKYKVRTIKVGRHVFSPVVELFK